MADDSTRETDPFGQALDVAKAALDAREQAIIAKEKADRIEELAQQAVQESITLRNLAANLASTAVSVAGVAMGATGATNLRDAYNFRAKSYNKKISLGSFLDVMQFGQTANPSSSSDECGLKQWQSNETVLKTPSQRSRNYTIIRNLSDNEDTESDTKLPGVRTVLKPADYEQELSPAHSWTRPMNHPSRENLEKFPFPGGVSEHKENLALSFESTGNIKPLWEDRYVQPEATGSISSAQKQEGSWQERKAMKQFQFKLAKAEQDVPEKSPQEDATEDDILKTPKCVLKVREEEQLLRSRSPEDDQEVLNTLSHSTNQSSGCLVSPVLPNSRSASPLLNAAEREHYTVSLEKEPAQCTGAAKPRHKFTPGNNPHPPPH